MKSRLLVFMKKQLETKLNDLTHAKYVILTNSGT